MRDGRYALIEYKLGSKDIDEAAQHLLKLHKLIIKHNDEDSSYKMKEPGILMVIAGVEIAHTRPDGVKIVPTGCLKN